VLSEVELLVFLETGGGGGTLKRFGTLRSAFFKVQLFRPFKCPVYLF